MERSSSPSCGGTDDELPPCCRAPKMPPAMATTIPMTATQIIHIRRFFHTGTSSRDGSVGPMSSNKKLEEFKTGLEFCVRWKGFILTFLNGKITVPSELIYSYVCRKSRQTIQGCVNTTDRRKDFAHTILAHFPGCRHRRRPPPERGLCLRGHDYPSLPNHPPTMRFSCHPRRKHRITSVPVPFNQ